MKQFNDTYISVSELKNGSKIALYSDYTYVLFDCAINFFKAKPYYLQKSVKRLKTLC